MPIDKDTEILLDNEKEWRRYMMRKVDKIDDQLDHLKLKVAAYSGIIGLVSGFLSSHIKDMLNK